MTFVVICKLFLYFIIGLEIKIESKKEKKYTQTENFWFSTLFSACWMFSLIIHLIKCLYLNKNATSTEISAAVLFFGIHNPVKILANVSFYYFFI